VHEQQKKNVTDLEKEKDQHEYNSGFCNRHEQTECLYWSIRK
jgi:hypothetical protein